MKRMLAVVLATLWGFACAQEISLRAGESADLFPVYWIAECKSQMVGFAGTDILAGPPGLKATIREQPVRASRQGCADMVPGGILVLSAGEVSESFAGTVRIRVRYKTENGERQSTHQVKVSLFPAPAR